MGLMDKIKKTIGNERIGELDGEREKTTKQSKPTKKSSKNKGVGKFSKPKPNKQVEEVEDDFANFDFSKDAEKDGEDHAEKYIKSSSVGGRSRRMILDSLGIKTGEIIPNEFVTPQQIENVEFTVSVPSGLDSQEVSLFCDNMEAAVKQYRTALLDAYEDREKLIEEVVRTEQAVVEGRNQAELNSVLSMGSDERDQINEKLINAQAEKLELENENSVLKRKLKEAVTHTLPRDKELAAVKENEQLRRELEELRQATESAGNQDVSEEVDTLHQELELARERNDQLSKTIEDLNETIKSNRHETTADSSKVAELEEQVRQLIAKNETLKASGSEAITIAEVETPVDYEKKIVEKFLQTNKPSKHVKTSLTPEEIKKMKAANSTGDIRIKGFEPVDPGDDDPFAKMMAEMNED